MTLPVALIQFKGDYFSEYGQLMAGAVDLGCADDADFPGRAEDDHPLHHAHWPQRLTTVNDPNDSRRSGRRADRHDQPAAVRPFRRAPGALLLRRLVGRTRPARIPHSGGFARMCSTRCASCRCRCCAGRAAATPTTITGATASGRANDARADWACRAASRSRTTTAWARTSFWPCAPTLGAEPYLAGNVGSGTPQELCDWLEYCNTARRHDPDARARAPTAPLSHLA